MGLPTFYPLNDFVLRVKLETIDDTSGAVLPLTTGTPTGFIATSDSPTATAADPTLVPTITYSGANGEWLVKFTGDSIDPATAATLFGGANPPAPFVIVELIGSIRVAIPVAYKATRTAVVV